MPQCITTDVSFEILMTKYKYEFTHQIQLILPLISSFFKTLHEAQSLQDTFDLKFTYKLPKLAVYSSVANGQGLVQNDKAVDWLLSIRDSVIGLSLSLMHLI